MVAWSKTEHAFGENLSCSEGPMKPLDKTLIALSLLMAVLAAEHLYALSCEPPAREQAQLELESVEVDGQAQSDMSAYDGYGAGLRVAEAETDVVFVVETADPANEDHLERTHREVSPGEEQ